jgi:energy-coupling factor transporter ATP-binding protein EcfA2
MSEGSGFLQWLSVYTYAINNEIDILLLDEPDAHLHCSLQTLLLDKLIEICNKTNKQVLLASHSTELIKYGSHEQVLEVKGGGAKYLNEESQKVALIGGLGTEYSPVINKLQKTKTVIFTENKSDVDFLKIWCATLNLKWPKNLVEWPFANDHKQRKQLFHHLKEEIKNLNGISIVDRDNDLYTQTKSDLSETYSDWEGDGSKLRYRKWRRWEIENYLICPEAIARAAAVDEPVVRDFIQTEFSFSIPTGYRSSDRRSNTLAMFDTDGKIILSAIGKKFNITKYDIAKEMKPSEIFDDVQILIKEVITMCE